MRRHKGKGGLYMEKKKIKIGKYIAIVLLVLCMIVIVLTARKMIIFHTIQEKIAKYENSTNLYVKTVSERSATVESFEKFILGDLEKDVIISKDKPTKVTQYLTPTQRTMYIDSGEKKVMNISHDENVLTSTTKVVNYVGYDNFIILLGNAFLTRVTEEKMDGKECYVVSGYVNGFLYTQDTIEVKVYIDKETGLTKKLVEVVKEEGKKKEYTITYTYQLDSVTLEDMQEPDKSAYTME